jgi:hypothetical protein
MYFYFPPVCALCRTHLIFLDFITLQYFVQTKDREYSRFAFLAMVNLTEISVVTLFHMVNILRHSRALGLPTCMSATQWLRVIR